MAAFDWLILICAIGCGLMAGVFFAFSTSVMTALGKLPPEQGIAAMQGINAVILNPLFLGTFLGTAIMCAIALGAGYLQWRAPGMLWVTAGAILYLGGSFLVTMVFNVPRNNRLMRVSPTSLEAIPVWREYLRMWTAWNHLRTAASAAAAGAFTVGAILS